MPLFGKVIFADCQTKHLLGNASSCVHEGTQQEGGQDDDPGRGRGGGHSEAGGGVQEDGLCAVPSTIRRSA